MDSDSQGMEAMDTSGGGQQQLVYVSEDGTSYIYPTDQTAGGTTEGLVTYIYGGDGDATGTVSEGAVGDSDVQYLLVSADEASGITQQQQHQFIMLPQSIGESSAGTTVVTETKKPVQSATKSTTPVSVLLSTPSAATSATSKQGQTAEVKVKGGTARVTILPAASKSTGTTSAPTTTIPIRIVSSSVSTTQTISIPVKSSPKVTVSVKASPSKLPPAIVSLPKISVIPAATTTVSSPAAKKLGRPRRETTATTTTAAAAAAAAPGTPVKDALHQLTKPVGVTKPVGGKTPNVIVVPIQISKEMIAAKQSTVKTPAAAASGAAGSSDSEKATVTKTPKASVKVEIVKADKVGVKETPKGKKVKEEKDHKVEHSPPPLPTRRSKRESNLSMKLAEWGLLPSSGSRHAVTDDDEDVDDEESDDDDEEEDEDEIPLIKTVVKTSSSTPAAAPKKVVTIAKETKETKEVKDKETKEVKETTKEIKETKEIKDGKVTKEVNKESNIESGIKDKEPVKDSEKPSSPATAGTQTPTSTKTVTIVKATPSTSAAVSKATAATPVTTTVVKATPAVAKATPVVAKATPATGSKATPASGIVKKAATTSTPKLLQNKSLMCKPIMMTKATSCNPIRITKSTQTDEDGDMYLGTGGAKNVVPVPVPVFVPAPMTMFSLPVPYPVPIPLPIPVPCLVPTTRNSIAAIMKQLQELHDSLPSDPFEADMLKMAEAVAEASEDPDSQPAEHIDRKGNILMQSAVAAAAAVASSTDGPVDVLEMAMRMASETDHNGKDMQSTTTCDSMSLPVSSSGGGAPAAKRARLTIDSSPVGMDESLPAPLMVVEPLRGPTPTPIVRAPINDSHMRLKYSYGLNAWKQWVTAKNIEIEGAATSTTSLRANSRPAAKLLKTEILQCSPDELNGALSLFVREVRKPTGQTYAPDSIYYLCLGIQHYLFENGRVDNIFTDVYYERFTDNLHELLSAYEVRLNAQGMIVCRVSEEHLWEARLLGAHSPRVLLNTLVYFNTKYFMLQSTDNHLSLSFSNILKQWKKNNSLDGKPIRSVYLRYNTIGYSPSQPGTAGSNLDAHRRRTLDPTPYEQLENIDNPLRCPVKLYEFYLSKCPESIRNRNDVFYLTPEPSCVPDSPVWYSAQPLSTEAMNKMLCRIRVVREIQETQLNQAPA